MRRRTVLMGLGAGLLAGCSRAAPPPPVSVAVLYDASKTYSTTDAKKAALEGTAGLVRALRAGDRLAFVRIGECSFSERAVLFDETLPARPDAATAAKLALLDEVERLKRRLPGENTTDITGALWQVHRLFLGEVGRRRILVIFSDLEEDIATSACRVGREASPDLAGAHVLLAGVTGLAADRGDPTKFFARVDAWNLRLAEAGALSSELVTGGADALRARVTELLSAPSL